MTTAVKEHPILFSGEMVKAILDGRKTQTRRVLKPQPLQQVVEVHQTEQGDFQGYELSPWDINGHDLDPIGQHWQCPYGTPGDRLWVRERFAYVDDECTLYSKPDHAVCYAATETAQWMCPPDADEKRTHGMDATYIPPDRWRPSIHMPRWASRITLEVVSVRVERLCEISRADVSREGIWLPDGHVSFPDTPAQQKRGMFMELWDSINDKHPWASNPWVWVVTFKVMECC